VLRPALFAAPGPVALEPPGLGGAPQGEPRRADEARPFARTVEESGDPYRAGGVGSRPQAREVAWLPAVPPVLGQYRQGFVVVQDEDALLLVDQHAAHERVLYERILREFREGKGAAAQALLFPRPVELGPALAARLPEVLAPLARFGFTIEPFGGGSIVVRAAPSHLPSHRLEPALRELIESRATGDGPETEGGLKVEQQMAAILACHAAARLGDPLSAGEMRELLADLFRCAEPQTCPHGRPSTIRWAHDEIVRAFQRPSRPLRP
jgi:DNA mismatch repair protein MutL